MRREEFRDIHIKLCGVTELARSRAVQWWFILFRLEKFKEKEEETFVRLSKISKTRCNKNESCWRSFWWTFLFKNIFLDSSNCNIELRWREVIINSYESIDKLLGRVSSTSKAKDSREFIGSLWTGNALLDGMEIERKKRMHKNDWVEL